MIAPDMLPATADELVEATGRAPESVYGELVGLEAMGAVKVRCLWIHGGGRIANEWHACDPSCAVSREPGRVLRRSSPLAPAGHGRAIDMSADKGGRPRTGTMVREFAGRRHSEARPCDHTSRPEIIDTRRRPDGSMRRRVECIECAERWSLLYPDAESMPSNRGAKPSIAIAIEREVRAKPGSTAAQIGAILGKGRHAVSRRLQVLGQAGRVERVGLGYWPAGHPIPAPAPIAPPAPVPVRYVGAIVPARPSGVMSAERIEMRNIPGLGRFPVKVLPSAIEPQRVHIPSVPRVRVNLSSQWGGL